MYFPSIQSQSSLFTQYFLPLSSTRAHPYLYLVKDPGREKVHEGDKFHLPFKHQWKTSQDYMYREKNENSQYSSGNLVNMF